MFYSKLASQSSHYFYANKLYSALNDIQMSTFLVNPNRFSFPVRPSGHKKSSQMFLTHTEFPIAPKMASRSFRSSPSFFLSFPL